MFCVNTGKITNNKHSQQNGADKADWRLDKIGMGRQEGVTLKGSAAVVAGKHPSGMVGGRGRCGGVQPSHIILSV